MTQQTYTFQAEISQLLDILVHSLYTEREIFLRELISNASDALNRVQFEMLTNDRVHDADAPLEIRITTDEEAGTLTISDSGIGMTADDMVNNLGTIARSGARAFIDAMKNGGSDKVNAQDVIGQFGVGFYSVFMVADKVQVISRSHLPDAPAMLWEATGGDNFTITEAQREGRGTDVVLHLKEDDREFLQGYRVKQIVRTHSDYVTFPIYVGDDDEPTNKRTAIWRKASSDVEDQEYDDFYKMMTMDFNPPLHRIHMRADVPLQFYALLYVPSSAEPSMFSPRKEPGLKLYARKILIQDYNKDMLPEWLQFIHGVVDTEDLPLNVSRESVQANRVMANLNKAITKKVIGEFKRMVKNKRDDYLKIFRAFSRYIKQGVVVSPDQRDEVMGLLLFHTTHDDNPEQFHTLDEYVERLAENQDDIYYIIADDWHSARRSPHLAAFRQRGIEVLYFTEPVDAAMVMGLSEYRGHRFRSVDEADIDLSEIGTPPTEEEQAEQPEPLPEDAFGVVVDRFKAVLGARVRDVRASKTTSTSPARLVSDESGGSTHLFRLNRLLDREYELPVKILELNQRHPLLHNLAGMMSANATVADAVIEQVFETALLQDGIHPDPASMAERITLLMQAATGSALSDLDFGALPETGVPEPEAAPEMDFDLDDMTAHMHDHDHDHDQGNVEDADFRDVDK